MGKMKELQIEKMNLEKEEKEEVSNCCTSPVYPESDICIRCGEHCEIILI